jgi:hypothetical protein
MGLRFCSVTIFFRRLPKGRMIEMTQPNDGVGFGFEFGAFMEAIR